MTRLIGCTEEAMKMYVEIRLLADQQAAERHADYEEAWREREGGQPATEGHASAEAAGGG